MNDQHCFPNIIHHFITHAFCFSKCIRNVNLIYLNNDELCTLPMRIFLYGYKEKRHSLSSNYHIKRMGSDTLVLFKLLFRFPSSSKWHNCSLDTGQCPSPVSSFAKQNQSDGPIHGISFKSPIPLVYLDLWLQ